MESAARQERLLSVGCKRKAPTDAEDRQPMYLKWQRLIDPDGHQPRVPTKRDRLQPTPSQPPGCLSFGETLALCVCLYVSVRVQSHLCPCVK
jgi:hypothetical protein